MPADFGSFAMEPSPVRRFADTVGTAEYLGTNVRHVRNLIDLSGLPHYKVGRLIRVDLDELDAWLQDRRGGVA